MTADDYAHVIIACLAHDIGYVRGLFKDDDADGFVIDRAGGKVTLPRGSSDAGLMPHHVDRSKLYVMRRIEGIAALNKQRIADAIEGTRFPPGEGQEYDEEASIVRAADFIGQLGDPNYLRKANALYHEFEEVGINRQLGYEFTRRHRQSLPAILLEQRGAAYSDRNTLSQHDLERTMKEEP